MTNELLATALLSNTGITFLDAARLIKNILDFKPEKTKLSNMQFCSKVSNYGIKHFHIKDMSIREGFCKYLTTKTQLRHDSLRDINYLGNRLLRSRSNFAEMNFYELSISDCEQWLKSTFNTSSQYNKAHSMLHGLFQFALRQEWTEKNIVKLVAKQKVIEREIVALSLAEIKCLLEISQKTDFVDCSAAVAILIWAGLRPKELTRLKWQDIDLEEMIITISSSTSKTGGVRHVEICRPLKICLQKFKKHALCDYICPHNWQRRWRLIRDMAGFKGKWVQDVLRHSYASYHSKHYQDLKSLQINMGHSSQALLRTRYVNMRNISKSDARIYFRDLV